MNNIYNAAEQARKNYENSLGYLITDLQSAQKADQDLLKSQYDELLSTINTNEQTLRNNYEQSAREAYVNKMMTERGLGEKLNQLGIDTQGTGINEYYNVGVDYGKNYAALQSALNAGLLDLHTERAGALSDYNAGLASLNKDYSGKLADLKLSISDRGQQVYNDYIANQMNWLNYIESQRVNNATLGGLYGGGGNTPKINTSDPTQYTLSDDGITSLIEFNSLFDKGILTDRVSLLGKDGIAHFYGKGKDGQWYARYKNPNTSKWSMVKVTDKEQLKWINEYLKGTPGYTVPLPRT